MTGCRLPHSRRVTSTNRHTGDLLVSIVLETNITHGSLLLIPYTINDDVLWIFAIIIVIISSVFGAGGLPGEVGGP